MRTLAISIFLLMGISAAQEISLGDLARQERARQEAVEAANFKPGNPPPVAPTGEVVPAHFLIIRGEAGQGEFVVKMNGQVIFHNSYVRDLPIYISSLLLDGGNLLEISLTSSNSPLDITVEERRAGQLSHPVLATFHSDASATPSPVNKQIRFFAHPEALPPIELNDHDRDAIGKIVKSFYDALDRKDGKQVLALFGPAIDDARTLYPEGADFGQKQMTRMAGLLGEQGFSMQPFDHNGLEMTPHGSIVTVKRADSSPVFNSSDISLPNGNHTSISADTIPVKKIQGQWRLTLPFGF